MKYWGVNYTLLNPYSQGYKVVEACNSTVAMMNVIKIVKPEKSGINVLSVEEVFMKRWRITFTKDEIDIPNYLHIYAVTQENATKHANDILGKMYDSYKIIDIITEELE